MVASVVHECKRKKEKCKMIRKKALFAFYNLHFAFAWMHFAFRTLHFIIAAGGSGMRIAISGMFWDQPTVGSGQYLRGLVGALAKVAPEHEYVLLLPAQPGDKEIRRQGDKEIGRLLVSLSPCLLVHKVRTPFDRRSANLAKLWFEQVGVPSAARRLGADLLHVPYFAPPLRSPLPVVATVLDIIPLLLPEYRGGPAVRADMRLVAQAARRADHVITISDDSRVDVIRCLGCVPERVTTIYLAAGPQYRPIDQAQARMQVAERYGLREPFVYYVGGLDARKNLETLLCAWWLLRRAGGPHATLAIAGRALGHDTRLFPDLDVLIAALGIQRTTARIDVPAADGPLLFAAATAFVFPSRYEGFGLPPLEAMACGTPAAVADASSLPEVVGDAALRVPPDDLHGWVAALWRLLADPRLRADLRRRGFERAAEFSYERAARETLAVYRQVLEGKQPAAGSWQ
jgi:glycosyltransferase involved in cell wall biosynthesis